MKIISTLKIGAVTAALLGVVGCRIVPDASAEAEFTQLPTGMKLDPAGTSLVLGSMPLSMVAAPGGRRVVALLSGWREQGFQVIDRASATVVQTVLQRAAFVGVA